MQFQADSETRKIRIQDRKDGPWRVSIYNDPGKFWSELSAIISFWAEQSFSEHERKIATFLFEAYDHTTGITLSGGDVDLIRIILSHFDNHNRNWKVEAVRAIRYEAGIGLKAAIDFTNAVLEHFRDYSPNRG